MPINSKKKGAAGEREFANLCRKEGYDVRRTAQFNGKELGSLADVVGLPGIHVEVKRVEALNVNKAMEQAIRDNASEDVPIVAHRKNGTEWLITMTAKDWFDLYRLKYIEDNNPDRANLCGSCVHHVVEGCSLNYIDEPKCDVLWCAGHKEEE